MKLAAAGRWSACLWLAILFVAAAFAPRVEAGSEPTLESSATYRVYCAGCHGLDADGNGDRADSLARRPADLRTLAQRYGPAIPWAELVARVVDPRRPGGPRICGDRRGAWELLHGYPAAVAKRGIVLRALDYLATAQVSD